MEGRIFIVARSLINLVDSSEIIYVQSAILFRSYLLLSFFLDLSILYFRHIYLSIFARTSKA